jgi:hypothetical protein
MYATVPCENSNPRPEMSRGQDYKLRSHFGSSSELIEIKMNGKMKTFAHGESGH